MAKRMSLAAIAALVLFLPLMQGQGCLPTIQQPDFNLQPTADAGPDKSVVVGDTVRISGRASVDPDDDPLTYFWEQTQGPLVELLNGNQETATFTPMETGDYVFALTVTDGEGLSDKDTVRVSVGVRTDDDLPDDFDNVDDPIDPRDDIEPGDDDDFDPADDWDDYDDVDFDDELYVDPIQGFWWGWYEQTATLDFGDGIEELEPYSGEFGAIIDFEITLIQPDPEAILVFGEVGDYQEIEYDDGSIESYYVLDIFIGETFACAEVERDYWDGDNYLFGTTVACIDVDEVDPDLAYYGAEGNFDVYYEDGTYAFMQMYEYGEMLRQFFEDEEF